MRIKHITLMAGPEGTFQPNTERDVPDGVGRALVAGRYAIEVKRRIPESAVVKAPETAVTAEQESAQALQKIAAAGKGGVRKGKRTAMTPAQEDEAARDAYAGTAPAPTSGEPSADVSTDSAVE
jgi:hypothetical protein